MQDKETLLQNLEKLVKGAGVLELPVILTEQYPKGLGPTLPEIAELLPGVQPVEKLCFSSCGEEGFRRALEASGRRQVLLAGIEAHICVYQTAVDLLGQGYDVRILADGVASRDNGNRDVCLIEMSRRGIGLTTVEMALFELLKVAGGDKFKQLSNIVK
jgi:hypothetical protein